jgi:hypothetical protein
MTFLEAYEVYAGGNEAPEIYHKWAGISVLSSLASRRVWCEQGTNIVMSNLYLMLVGTAGNGKSTAMKKARDLVRHFHPDFCPVPPKAMTFQSFVQDLGDDQQPHVKEFEYHGDTILYSHASMFCNEFATLLETNPIGWIGFLTDIYDEDSYEYKIKNPPKGGKKLDSISNPYLTLLGCMTPELTSSQVKEGVISTGFSRRCIFVYSNRSTKSIPIMQTTPEQLEAKDLLIKLGNNIVRLVGNFKWEDSARKYFEDWYHSNKRMLLNITDSMLASWLNSKDQIIVKVAMMLNLSKESDLTIRKENLIQAIDLIEKTEEHFPLIFSGAGRNPIAVISSKIRGMLQSLSEPVHEKKIFHAMHDHGNTEEIREAVLYLKDAQAVDFYEYDDGGVRVRLVGTPEAVENHRSQERGKTIVPQQTDLPLAADPAVDLGLHQAEP